MGKQALIVSENSDFPTVLGSVVGGEWLLRAVSSGREALKTLGEFGESSSPDLIVLDGDFSDADCLSFLKSAGQRSGGLPPTVLCVSHPLDDAGQAHAEEFGLLEVLVKPVRADQLERALAPLLWVSSGSGLRVVEFLGMALRRSLSGTYRMESGAMSADLELKQGRLLQVHSRLYVDRWRSSLEGQGGILPPPDSDANADIRNLEDATRGRPELGATKLQAVLAFLAAYSPAEAVAVRKVGDVEYHSELPVPLFDIVASLVDHCAEEQLAPLRSEVLVLLPGPVGVSSETPLSPQHGYLLSQCVGPSPMRSLLRTGVLPELQLLRAAYFLLILGLLGAEPEAPEPFSLQVMAERLEEKARRIRTQKEGIRNLGQSLRATGQNPYEALGLKPGASYERVLQSFETLRSQIGPNGLHPIVLKEMEAEVDWINAKVGEAFLLIQAQWLDDRHQRIEADAKESEQARARRMDPGKPQGPQITQKRMEEADQLYRRALSLKEEEEDYHQASQYVRLAIFYNPLCAPYHALQGRLFTMMKSIKAKHEAEQAFLKAAELEPQKVEYKVELARLYLELDLLARCRAQLEKIHALEPKNAELPDLRKALKERERG